jgi:hypothetical protein
MWLNQMFNGTQEGPGYQTILVGDGGPNTLVDQSLVLIPSGQIYPTIMADIPASSAITYSPCMTIFESEQEIQYFRFYCNTTAHQLSGVSTLRECCHELVS